MTVGKVDILVSIGGLIYELESTANKTGATIYNICHRNAGWAIQWHEKERQRDNPDWRKGLTIYRYYSTLLEMISGELLRLG